MRLKVKGRIFGRRGHGGSRLSKKVSILEDALCWSKWSVDINLVASRLMVNLATLTCSGYYQILGIIFSLFDYMKYILNFLKIMEMVWLIDWILTQWQCSMSWHRNWLVDWLNHRQVDMPSVFGMKFCVYFTNCCTVCVWTIDASLLSLHRDSISVIPTQR